MHSLAELLPPAFELPSSNSTIDISLIPRSTGFGVGFAIFMSFSDVKQCKQTLHVLPCTSIDKMQLQ